MAALQLVRRFAFSKSCCVFLALGLSSAFGLGVSAGGAIGVAVAVVGFVVVFFSAAAPPLAGVFELVLMMFVATYIAFRPAFVINGSKIVFPL